MLVTPGSEGVNVISNLPFEHVITTDASLVGWGAEYEGVSSGGNWTKRM